MDWYQVREDMVPGETHYKAILRGRPGAGAELHRRSYRHADDLSSLSVREVLKEAGMSTNYANCSSLGRKLAEYVAVVKDFP